MHTGQGQAATVMHGCAKTMCGVHGSAQHKSDPAHRQRLGCTDAQKQCVVCMAVLNIKVTPHTGKGAHRKRAGSGVCVL